MRCWARWQPPAAASWQWAAVSGQWAVGSGQWTSRPWATGAVAAWLGLSLLLIGCGEPSAANGTTLVPADATDPAESTLETPTPVAEEATPTPVRRTATATRIPRPTAAIAPGSSGPPVS